MPGCSCPITPIGLCKPRRPGCRHEMVSEYLHPAASLASFFLMACLRRTLQSASRGFRRWRLLLIDYVRLNPARAGMVAHEPGVGLLDYRWSSLAQEYGVYASQRPTWLAVPEGLELFGYREEARDRRKFVERLEQRAREDGGRVERPHPAFRIPSAGMVLGRAGISGKEAQAGSAGFLQSQLSFVITRARKG